MMVTFETSNDQLRIIFKGKQDTQACLEMSQRIDNEVAAASCSQAVFDLAEVTYVCSAFLRICIHVAKLKGERFEVVNATPPVMVVFRMAGLDTAFKVAGS